MNESESEQRRTTRARIVEAAARLLQEQGSGAVTTRAVAQAAGLQPPALYRLFADKDALLDAAAEHVFAQYVAAKRRTALTGDPLDDLRAGWRTQIEFGLANPAVFALMSDPVRSRAHPAYAAGLEILAARVHRVAAEGRLRVDEDRAVAMIRAAGTGAVHTLLAQPPESRDPGLADALFEAVTRTVLTDAPALPVDDVTSAVTAFRALVPRLPGLTPAEASLMEEWLSRRAAVPAETG
ncbi:TetR/AcrR family transcriptional regulator [Streptomyces seoulensis]|nr:TetR/AcrR family transcriptional regulator [Streptomyces seoulensis]